jgi:hypothetical protein
VTVTPKLPPRPPALGDLVPILGGGPADGEKIEFQGHQVLRTPTPEPPDPAVGYHHYRLQLVPETVHEGATVVWGFFYVGRSDA